MIERWAYKFRIYPDVLQDWLFRNTIGCCRVVYNTCLSQRQLEWHRSERDTSQASTRSRN